MRKKNRDLIVLFNQELMSRKELESHVLHLHEMLYNVEHIQHLSRTHEVLDLNSYQVYRNPLNVRSFLKHTANRPFVFVLNRN